MQTYLYEILKALGTLIFVYPTIAVFKGYLQTLENRKEMEGLLSYHFPTIYALIDKYKKEKEH